MHQPRNVTRDVYTQFFKEVFNMYSSGNHANVPTGLSAEECEKFRRIECHSFIQFNIFPVQIEKAFFEQVVMDSVHHNVLLESFQEFEQKNEIVIIKKFKRGEQVYDEEKSALKKSLMENFIFCAVKTFAFPLTRLEFWVLIVCLVN